MIISFIDILYSLAIGTGFTYFPENPISNLPGTIAFIVTVFISAHDWYEYHENAKFIPQAHALFYHIWQIFVVLMLNQMFRHSSALSLQTWLIYFACFAILNAIWNMFLNSQNRLFFVACTSIVAILNLLASGFYPTLATLIPSIDVRWIVIVGEVLLLSIWLLVVNIL